MGRRLTVDVVGCGEIAQLMHLPHLLELSDACEVRAICERDPHVLKTVADRFGIEGAFTDHREMLAQSPADVLVVLTSGDHVTLINDAIDAGMDVFVEKPLCYSTEDAWAIARRAEEAGRTVMVGYSRLFDTAFDDLKAALGREQGPIYLRAEASLPWDYYYRAHHDIVRPLDWAPPATVVEDRAPSWGGSWEFFREELLFNLAIHEVYCLRVLTGIDRPEIRTVSDVLDRRGIEATWSGGGAGGLDGEGVHASMSVLTLDTVAGGYVEEFRAVTGASTYLLEYPSIYLKSWPAKLSRSTVQDGTLVSSSTLGSFVDPFKAELEHFFAVLTEGVPCVSTAADAALDVETLNRLYEAARAHGKTIAG
ncbi:Gfo/Idh/MocA family oxidoreductase [Actinomadura barringtoniae]|uniref:Gfo/Idh/MocA family oxidoreductase n=1 Tax=Actinomadura barringtoniae TaxID=1427535 RepID=A0A939P7K6_9ACTN|nr:Gfo/Idh/MocA family oxidoreductase [Actinomadura barringtoniae]MBO2447191.1 Gfo/Idh/MocA family oxidoreductase [Actinomadura barringtoniae]